MIPHPIDALIRELILDPLMVASEMTDRVVEHIAHAPFLQIPMRIPVQYRDHTYLGRRLAARDDPLFFHVVEHIAVEQQWRPDTTAEEYLDYLRRAVRWPASRIAAYNRRGGPIVMTATPTAAVVSAERRGTGSLPWLAVIYSVERGVLLSDYQFSRLDRLAIPEDARWLR